MSLGAMYGRTTVRPIVDKRWEDIAGGAAIVIASPSDR
jgi:hypothetical protein